MRTEKVKIPECGYLTAVGLCTAGQPLYRPDEFAELIQQGILGAGAKTRGWQCCVLSGDRSGLLAII